MYDMDQKGRMGLSGGDKPDGYMRRLKTKRVDRGMFGVSSWICTLPTLLYVLSIILSNSISILVASLFVLVFASIAVPNKKQRQSRKSIKRRTSTGTGAMCYVIIVLWLAAWGIMGGGGSAATLPGSMSLALNPVDGDRVGGMQASRTVAGGFLYVSPSVSFPFPSLLFLKRRSDLPPSPPAARVLTYPPFSSPPRTNPTATPSDPFTYAVPHSPVSLTFFNYGAPVPRNPALICLGAAENDFWERVGGSKLDKPVGQTLEYRVQRVYLTVIPVGGVRGLRC